MNMEKMPCDKSLPKQNVTLKLRQYGLPHGLPYEKLAHEVLGLAIMFGLPKTKAFKISFRMVTISESKTVTTHDNYFIIKKFIVILFEG